MADRISDWRGVQFQRVNFYRLRDGTLSGSNVEIIVSWLEAHFDPSVRTRLHPQAIFDEVGRSTRDYYFHLPPVSDVDDWNRQIVDTFAGVYLCAPTDDLNSYMPLPTLRRWFDDHAAVSAFSSKMRSNDLKQYIHERVVLVLQKTNSGYFYAAEIPTSVLFMDTFETLDLKMMYEGVGIVSGNTIQVQLRECLSRVPKTHSILIKNKTPTHLSNPFGLQIYLSHHYKAVREEWAQLSRDEREALRRELKLVIDAPQYLAGPVQIAASPVADMRSAISVNFSRDYVYHQKPRDFLSNAMDHFIRPDLLQKENIERILDNPLVIGELLWQ